MNLRKLLLPLILLSLLTGCSKPNQNKPDAEEKPVVEAPASTAPDDVKKDDAQDSGDVLTFDSAPVQAIARDESLSDDEKLSKLRAYAKTTTSFKDTDWGEIQITSLSGFKDLQASYEIPVFNRTFPAADKVNAFFQSSREENFNQARDKILSQYADKVPGSDTLYFNHNVTRTEFANNYVSVSISYEWYAGGVNDFGSQNYVFDPESGEQLELLDFCKNDAKTVNKRIKAAFKAQYPTSDEAYAEIFKRIDEHEGYDYYIENGQIVVQYDKYEIAAGAAGSFDIRLPQTVL